MPRDRDFKRVVRRRMAATGERYTTARAALEPGTRGSPRHLDGLVRELSRAQDAPSAYAALRALPARRLRPLARAGLDDPDWRVRRSCARLLDDLALTPASTAALERCLDDPHPLVRRAALHTLSCKHCKPDGCTLDVRPIFERMASDPNRRVRSAVLHPLTWAYDQESWAPELLRRFAERDPSAQLRGVARDFLAVLERRSVSDQRRRQLPPELRAKTERHYGKWVAVSGGAIVAVGDPRAIRHAVRTWPDTVLYWVGKGTRTEARAPSPIRPT